MTEPSAPNEPRSGRELEMTTIDSLLGTLKAFETDQQDPRVEYAKAFLKMFLWPHKPWLAEQGLIPTIHGSMQYHDPNNLDTDLTFIGEDDFTHEQDMEMRRRIRGPLEKVWLTGEDKVEVSASTLRDIQKELESNEDLFGEDSFASDHAAVILSSELLFEEDAEQYDLMKQKVRQLLATHGNLRKATIQELRNVIAIRQERRAHPPAGPTLTIPFEDNY